MTKKPICGSISLVFALFSIFLIVMSVVMLVRLFSPSPHSLPEALRGAYYFWGSIFFSFIGTVFGFIGKSRGERIAPWLIGLIINLGFLILTIGGCFMCGLFTG